MVPAIGLPELQIFRKSTNDILAYQIEVNRPMPGVFVAETPSDDVSAVWGPEIAKALLDMNAVLHLPEWKPEGYINSVETTIETDVIWGGHIRQEFQDDDGNRIMLSVFVYPDDGNFGMTVHVQHDNTENETWKYGGIDYTYVNNLGVRSVSWSEGNCWTQIYGEPTRDELHKMIKSIYD